jgi:hypothetical protein
MRQASDFLVKYNSICFDNSGLRFEFRQVSEDCIRDIILGLKNTSCCGWDEIPANVVKSSCEYIYKPLTHVVNLALCNGEFPKKMKYALIKPLFKKGDRQQLINYRPIAILPVLSKVVERVVLIQLVDFLEDNAILCKEQYGFRKNKSTKEAVYDFINGVLESLDGRNTTYGLFCDLSRAFDMVDHELLLMKLNNYGISGKAGDFFRSYLCDRYQSVLVTDRKGNFIKSEWKKVVRGIPQGSILGPILFNIYVNDLPSNVNCNLTLFADDTTAFVADKSDDDCLKKLENAAYELTRWFSSNGLKWNTSKTKVMEFRTIQNHCKGCSITFPTGDVCHRVNTAGFLGYQLQDSLKWDKHVISLIGKLSYSVYAIRVLRGITSVQSILSVYHGYFVSRVKYSILFWGSMNGLLQAVFKTQKNAIRAIEGVQRRESCKPLFKKYRLLTVPALYFLEVAVWAHKNKEKFNALRHKHPYETRHKNTMLSYPVHRLTKLERGPFYAGLRVFNSLSLDLKQMESGKKFARALKLALTTAVPYSVEECFYLFRNCR